MSDMILKINAAVSRQDDKEMTDEDHEKVLWGFIDFCEKHGYFLGGLTWLEDDKKESENDSKTQE